MISKHELCKIAIVSAATILMIVSLISAVDSQTENVTENTTIVWMENATGENTPTICQGTPLSYDQLDAKVIISKSGEPMSTATGGGTFYYDPNVGTVLNEGQNQPLTVRYVPANLNLYNPSSKTVHINVIKCPKEHGFFHQTEYSTYLPFQWG
jgi:hypothetical protein